MFLPIFVFGIKWIFFTVRKNLHEFATEQEAKESLIYNYPVTYTALQNSTSFQQCYMFKKSDRDHLIIDNNM